jgi:dTDP-4-dehydrorhamnose 3,5-epimerase
MKFLPSEISGIVIIEPRVFGDERGFFMETFQEKLFQEAGIPVKFVQDNHSGSRRGILRGLHYQVKQVQGKLVRVVAGEIYDVAVDIRASSPTCGKWVGLRLSAANRRQVWIPPGFAHGFYVLSDWAEVIYKTTDFYAPQWERTLMWNDPDIAIQWTLSDDQPPILSPKDANGTRFREIELLP